MLSTQATCVFVLMLAAGAAYGQGVGASGSIHGNVTDPTGAGIPGATVVATDEERGAKYTAPADSRGQYNFASLPPGTYDLRVESAGFGAKLQKGVVVSVGSVTSVDFSLEVAHASTTVEVNAAPLVIDSVNGKQADTINQDLVQDLPINRRDYLTFTLLLPGRVGLHSDRRRPGFSREANAQQRPFFLRQQRPRQQRYRGWRRYRR